MSQTNGRSVAFTFDKERHLRIDFNALCALADKLGKRVEDVFAAGRIGFPEMRALLWAALISEDPTLTVEQSGTLIQTAIDNGQPLLAIMDAVTDALRLSGLYASTSDAPTAGSGSPFPSADSSPTASLPPSDSSAATPGSSSA